MAGTSLLRLQSDERLAELASAGHESAFDAIVDRYRTPLTRYCAGIVGPSRAEDAVQQALINAHDALQRTDAVRNLRPWLYRIAHNAALNVLRAVRDDAPLDERTLRGAHATASPAESFERSEEFRATLAALQALPERQRAALVLRELEGRSHEEIAAALGVTKGSARQHLMRARVAVRGAVTAVTPYPLIARLSEWASAGAGASAPGWVDTATTAGAGASLAKLTAGLAATGALVGGAVGTEHVVRGGGSGSDSASAAPRAAERAPERAVKRAGKAVVLPATAVTPAATSSRPASDGRRDAASRSSSRAERRRAGRSAPRDGGSAGASAPASASTPTTPSAEPATRQPSSDHRSKKAEQKSSHGRETSASNRPGHATGKDKASKDVKPQKAKKNGKGDAPGQAKETAPSTSSPAAPEGSDGKGSKGNGSNPSKGNGASGSNGKGSTKTGSSGADDTDAATTPPATESPSASTPSPTTTDDD